MDAENIKALKELDEETKKYPDSEQLRNIQQVIKLAIHLVDVIDPQYMHGVIRRVRARIHQLQGHETHP